MNHLKTLVRISEDILPGNCYFQRQLWKTIEQSTEQGPVGRSSSRIDFHLLEELSIVETVQDTVLGGGCGHAERLENYLTKILQRIFLH